MIKKLALVGAAVAVLGSTIAIAPTAQAATAQNGVCEVGEFCLYYNSDQQGSLSDMSSGHKDYGTGTGCVEFISSGAGRGLCVKNNAASAWNREDAVVTVFYKSDWAGAIDSIGADTKANLNSTLKNENAGHTVGAAASTHLERAVYNGTGGRITSYYDGYLSTPGRHEGIDFARAIGDNVYSLTDGTVTNVVQGSTGSGGLSTIAIYNSAHDKTMVYLHTDPLNTLTVGSWVNRGEKIAVESWRGVSSSSSAHTHVEVRNGRQTNAATSVGDPDLTNPNPTQFWKDRDYNICCDS